MRRFLLRARRARCPSCRRRTGVPILYGMPGPEAFEAQERGELELGGCVIVPGAPTHRCTRCGHAWARGWRRLAG